MDGSDITSCFLFQTFKEARFLGYFYMEYIIYLSDLLCLKFLEFCRVGIVSGTIISTRPAHQISVTALQSSCNIKYHFRSLIMRTTTYTYYLHCCMKCPQIIREKTSSQKYTVIALRIQWKLSAEGKCL